MSNGDDPRNGDDGSPSEHEGASASASGEVGPVSFSARGTPLTELKSYESIMGTIDFGDSMTGVVIQPNRAGRFTILGSAGLLLLGAILWVTYGVIDAREHESAAVAALNTLVVADEPTEHAAAVVEPPTPTPPTEAPGEVDAEPQEILVADEKEEPEAEADAETEADAGTEAEPSAEPHGAPKARATKAKETPSFSAPPGTEYTELDATTVRKTIRSRMVHLHRCFDNVLSDETVLRGKVLIEITIGISGRVTRVDIKKDTLRAQPVTDCITKNLKRWRFHLDGRLLREPTEVTFPVAFSS